MNNRSRKYFEREKRLRRPWRTILAFPVPEMPLFRDQLLNGKFNGPICVICPPSPAYESHYHLSHIDEMAMTPLHLPAPVIKHMDFVVKTNEFWEQIQNIMGIPAWLLSNDSMPYELYSQIWRDRHPVTGEPLDYE